jgi:hypothetical protein
MLPLNLILAFLPEGIRHVSDPIKAKTNPKYIRVGIKHQHVAIILLAQLD